MANTRGLKGLRGKAVREPRLATTLGSEPHWVKDLTNEKVLGFYFVTRGLKGLRGKAVREPRLAMTLGSEPHWVKRSNERESTGLLFRYKNKIVCVGSELAKWIIMKCKPKG